MIKQRKNHNFIHRLQYTEGSKCLSLDTAAKAFMGFHKGLTGTAQDVSTLDMNQVIVGPSPILDHQNLLLAPFMTQDMKAALFSMDEDKAVGLVIIVKVSTRGLGILLETALRLLFCIFFLF